MFLRSGDVQSFLRLKCLYLIKVMKLFSFALLLEDSNLVFPSSSMVSIFSLLCYCFSSVMQTSVGMLPQTTPKYSHTYTKWHANAQPAESLQILFPIHLDFPLFKLLFYFFISFKGEDSDVTMEPQLQLRHMLSEKFQPSGQSLFIARRKQ